MYRTHPIKSLSISKISLFLLIAIVLMCNNGSYSQSTSDTSVIGILNQAYAKLQKEPTEALPLFEQAASMDLGNISIHNQLGYLYLSLNKTEESLRQFQVSDSLQPSDTTKLQIAYILISLNRNPEADKILLQLISSTHSDIRESAENQLKVSPTSPMFSKWWTRIYLSPYYDTRWKTSIYFGNIEQGYYLKDDKKLSAFGFLLVSGDGRSERGLAPAIFSDNVLIAGVGIRVEPFYGFQLHAQQGIAFDLVGDSASSKPKGDFRAEAIYNNGIYPDFSLHNNVRMTLSPLLDVYSSFGYYSRYNNNIGYLQGRAGVRALEISYSAVDIYLKGGLAIDTKKEFYNNLCEGGFGFPIMPNVNWGLYIIGEYQRGLYWDVGDSTNPYDKYYNSFRLFIVFDRMF